MTSKSAASTGPAVFAVQIAIMLVAAFLSGCVDMEPSAETAAPARPNVMARREGVSPMAASIALASVAGAPQPQGDQFKALFDKEAQAREISFADAEKARYLVRGYINAASAGANTSVAFVLDVFDAKRRRAQRIEDQIFVKAAAADPWSVVDQAAIAALAAKSAEDLAAFLTNTPEAIASAGKPEGRQSAEDGQTTMAATSPAPPARPLVPESRATGLASALR